MVAELLWLERAPFTEWVVQDGILNESFNLIDVGCFGGIHPRWNVLGDCLEAHGFDAIEEEIDRLRKCDKGPGRRCYHSVAVGREDGARDLYVAPMLAATSFYASPAFEATGPPENIRRADKRTVTVRRLDTLFREGAIPTADFIKMDCEGAEVEVLAGARNYFVNTAPFGVETESSFKPSIHMPLTHFGHLLTILAEHRLVVFDFATYHGARNAFLDHLEKSGLSKGDVLSYGQAGTLNVLFCQDYVNQRVNPSDYTREEMSGQFEYSPPSLNRLVKGMVVFELYGLPDCAYELMIDNSARLGGMLDIEKAAALLSSGFNPVDRLRGNQEQWDAMDYGTLQKDFLGTTMRRIRKKALSTISRLLLRLGSAI